MAKFRFTIFTAALLGALMIHTHHTTQASVLYYDAMGNGTSTDLTANHPKTVPAGGSAKVFIEASAPVTWDAGSSVTMKGTIANPSRLSINCIDSTAATTATHTIDVATGGNEVEVFAVGGTVLDLHSITWTPSTVVGSTNKLICGQNVTAPTGAFADPNLYLVLSSINNWANPVSSILCGNIEFKANLTLASDLSFGDATHNVLLTGNSRQITTPLGHAIAFYGETSGKLEILFNSTTAAELIFRMQTLPALRAGADNAAFTLQAPGSTTKSITFPFLYTDDHPMTIDVSADSLNGWTLIFQGGVWGETITFTGPIAPKKVTVKGLSTAFTACTGNVIFTP